MKTTVTIETGQNETFTLLEVQNIESENNQFVDGLMSDFNADVIVF